MYNNCNGTRENLPFKILIVDSSPESFRALSAMLQHQGYNVRNVLRTEMTLLAAQLAPPDAILLSLETPEVHGYKIYQKLKANPVTAKIPVIFISLQDGTTIKQQVKAVGGAGFLTKPYHAETVLRTIKSVLQPQLFFRYQTEIPVRYNYPLNIASAIAMVEHGECDEDCSLEQMPLTQK